MKSVACSVAGFDPPSLTNRKGIRFADTLSAVERLREEGRSGTVVLVGVVVPVGVELDLAVVEVEDRCVRSGVHDPDPPGTGGQVGTAPRRLRWGRVLSGRRWRLLERAALRLPRRRGRVQRRLVRRRLRALRFRFGLPLAVIDP